jgi:hypothetical protein
MFTESRRDRGRYKHQVMEYESLQDFLKATPSAGIISIKGALPIDLLYVPAGGDTTVVSFHAASRPASPLPIFAGANVTADHGVNRIYVSDPGLYCDDEVKIAWFAGSSECCLQDDLPKILEKLIDAAEGFRTVFWGPSAGGFAALYYSKFFPDSLAIPVNPQTVLANFGYENQRNYTRAAFDALTPAEHDVVFNEKICSDLRKHYAGKTPNYILYVQNLLDPHVEQHMLPFLDSLEPTFRVRKYESDAWGLGHVAPPVEELRRIVGSMTHPEMDWSAYFSEAGR